MRLHLKRLASGALILAILLGALWTGIHNDQMLNTILYVISFCVISYLIGYFLMKIREERLLKKLNAMKKFFIQAARSKKVKPNDSRRAAYRKNSKQQRNYNNK